MKRALLVGLLCVFAAPPAQAQIAAAVGKPLPSPDMPAGEVSVRVVAGSPANPVIGADVTLFVNGTPRVARSDSAGRAFFKDLPVGATVKAQIKDEEGKDSASEEFQLPPEQGMRLLLSTRPFQPGAMPSGMGGAGAQGMPNPRAMSGEPRPEQADSPGTFTVRVTYDDFKDTPEGVPVTLVGYAGDGRVTVETLPTDKEGRVKFKGLDRSGATAYFAMTQLPRNGGVDRLVAKPAVLDASVGVRLILSSEKRDSTSPPLDDQARLDPQDAPIPGGKVIIEVAGVPDLGGEVVLYDAATRTPFARGKTARGNPDPKEVQAEAQFTDKPNMPAGTVDVKVHGGPAGSDEGLADINVRIAPAVGGAATGPGIESKTSADGTVRLAVQQPPNALSIAILTVNGKPLTSQPFDLSKSGGVLDVEAHWEAVGKPEAVFDVIPKPSQVFYAETTSRGQSYRSAPFQVVEGRGTHVTLFVYPRVLFSFSLTSHIDDQFLAVSGRFTVENNSWIPYVASPDGMVLPLPKGFKGAIVAERDQAEVSVAPGEGYRIVRPIPPGKRIFGGAFSLPVEDGRVVWDLDLPWGSFQSGMEILQTEGMRVETPDGVSGQTVSVPQGTFFVLPSIQILPRQRMVMAVTGLPAAPAWRTWVPRIVGVFVVLLMLGGLFFALRRSSQQSAEAAAREARRQKLLDELVELEKIGKADKKRDAIIAELETLWD